MAARAPAISGSVPAPTPSTSGISPRRSAVPASTPGVVTGWTGDTLQGPVFRLVNTVVVADTGRRIVARLNGIPAGGNGRLFFSATEDGRSR